MPGIVAFGEMMLHLSPPSFQRLRQAGSFNAVYGGSEANTAAALAQWGEHAVFITKLPENELGDACVSVLRSYGVDTSFIMRGEGRIGIYFSEKGASQRPQLVLYDRQNSVFSLSGPGDFDFTSAMAGADWFHFSGITPALGDNLVGLTKTALNTARSRGLKISCDFNYRSKALSEEKARHAMRST
jgi:2-dehydro-3-deoxygluconokinase